MLRFSQSESSSLACRLRDSIYLISWIYLIRWFGLYFPAVVYPVSLFLVHPPTCPLLVFSLLLIWLQVFGPLLGRAWVIRCCLPVFSCSFSAYSPGGGRTRRSPCLLAGHADQDHLSMPFLCAAQDHQDAAQDHVSFMSCAAQDHRDTAPRSLSEETRVAVSPIGLARLR